MTGGEPVVIRHCLATGRAAADYNKLDPESRSSARELAARMVGRTCRRMADDSPYFLLIDGPFRFVFCVMHGRKLESGQMALVRVNRNWDHD